MPADPVVVFIRQKNFTNLEWRDTLCDHQFELTGSAVQQADFKVVHSQEVPGVADYLFFQQVEPLGEIETSDIRGFERRQVLARLANGLQPRLQSTWRSEHQIYLFLAGGLHQIEDGQQRSLNIRWNRCIRCDEQAGSLFGHAELSTASLAPICGQAIGLASGECASYLDKRPLRRRIHPLRCCMFKDWSRNSAT